MWSSRHLKDNSDATSERRLLKGGVVGDCAPHSCNHRSWWLAWSGSSVVATPEPVGATLPSSNIDSSFESMQPSTHSDCTLRQQCTADTTLVSSARISASLSRTCAFSGHSNIDGGRHRCTWLACSKRSHHGRWRYTKLTTATGSCSRPAVQGLTVGGLGAEGRADAETFCLLLSRWSGIAVDCVDIVARAVWRARCK